MLKGRTRIELTNIHTGEREVVEKDNLVTNALQYIFNPAGYIKASGTMFGSTFVNFYANLTGGLLLLDTALTEDAETINLPRNVKQTGCAVYNQQNSSGQTIRGNYNATESEIDTVNKKVKYVYDFDTAEGNGTIACVSLTHAYGGYGTNGTSVMPTTGKYPLYTSVGTGNLHYTGPNNGISAMDRSGGYLDYGSGLKWIIKIDATTDSVYYFSITGTSAITIYRYRANITTISLFDTPASSRTILESTDISLNTSISQQYFSYNYDEETDKLYIVSASSYSVANGKTYVITEIDLANDFAVTQYTMTNSSGLAMRVAYNKSDTWCYEGKIYFKNYSTSTHSFFRQEIGNSTNIEKLETSDTLKGLRVEMARNGKLYCEYTSSYGGVAYVVDVDTFTLTYPETTTFYDSNDRQFVPVKGFPLLYYLTQGSYEGTFAIRTDYLATVNNLSSPVVKTADKTMKVTYTLTEEVS